MRWELLDRYLSGRCDAAELELVERWLAEAPVHRELLEQLRALEASQSLSPSEWAVFRARLERELGLDRPDSTPDEDDHR
jgi:ferric-dicitrate binding protein FerR (iron transport regulator)